jgi:hypothetical protein
MSRACDGPGLALLPARVVPPRPPPPDAPQLRAVLDAVERRARQMADACFAAWDASVSQRAAGSSRFANLLMDAHYVASTTARLCAHADDYQLHMITMMAAVCRRTARRCAQRCEGEPGLPMATCVSAARASANACDELLRMLWDGVPLDDASEDDAREDAARDDDASDDDASEDDDGAAGASGPR